MRVGGGAFGRIEHDSKDAQSLLLGVLDREQGVVQGPKTQPRHDEDRQVKSPNQIYHGPPTGQRNQQPPNPLHDQERVPMDQGLECPMDG